MRAGMTSLAIPFGPRRFKYNWESGSSFDIKDRHEDLSMRHRTKATRIGALAAAAGVTVDTLRYYEREGLLPRPSRTAGGCREYAPEIAGRLRFIGQAQRLGLSLCEIRQLVEPENGRCAAVREMIAARLADVDERVRELQSFRRTLRGAL